MPEVVHHDSEIHLRQKSVLASRFHPRRTHRSLALEPLLLCSRHRLLAHPTRAAVPQSTVELHHGIVVLDLSVPTYRQHPLLGYVRTTMSCKKILQHSHRPAHVHPSILHGMGLIPLFGGNELILCLPAHG